MPTYQYACTECGHGFEQFQSFSDDALTECPTCGGRLRKVFSSVGIVFKGSGFYRNDSREAAKKKDGRGKDGKEKESVGAGKADSSSGGSDTSSDKSPDKSATKSGTDKKSDSPAASTSSSSAKATSSPSGSSSSGSSSTAGSAA